MMALNPMLKVMVEEANQRRTIADLEREAYDLMFVQSQRVEAYERASRRVALAQAEARFTKAKSAEALAEMKLLKAVEARSHAEAAMAYVEGELSEAQHRLNVKRQAEAIAAE